MRLNFEILTSNSKYFSRIWKNCFQSRKWTYDRLFQNSDLFDFGTIHLRRRQIFDPYPPTIDIPAKCLWRGFLILMYCDLWTPPPKTCWHLKWMVPMENFYNDLIIINLYTLLYHNINPTKHFSNFFAVTWAWSVKVQFFFFFCCNIRLREQLIIFFYIIKFWNTVFSKNIFVD